MTAGNGTESDPYVIQGWEIEANTTHGIDIKNTDKYFIIKNCVVHNAKSNESCGVHFYSVRRGIIENSEVYSNQADGIRLWDCSNITVASSAIHANSWHGIRLYNSLNNTITNCTIYNNGGHGIKLISSSNFNTISNCILQANSRDGIRIYVSSNNNTILSSLIYNNSWVGTRIYNSCDNWITKCDVIKNSGGIYIGVGKMVYMYSVRSVIYRNNIIRNGHSAVDGDTPRCANYWSGNYWSDYTGEGHSPYVIHGRNVDKYPQLAPLESPKLFLPWNLPPVSDFGYSPTAPVTFDTIYFREKSYDLCGTVISWFWDFGDGTASLERSTNHSYSSQGTYTITLTVTDDSNVNDTFSKEVIVRNKPPIAKAYADKTSIAWVALCHL